MTDPTPKRRRGAQPGNTNALKHGFYSKKFRRTDLTDLEIISPDDLTSEINMLRVITRKVFDCAQDDCQELDEWQEILNTLGTAATRLSHLMRTQTILQGDQTSDVAAALSSALSEVVKELNIK